MIAGGCEPLGKVDVTDLVAWIGGIDLAEWPQQSPLGDGQLRPAMVTDLGWNGFGEKTDPVVADLMAGFPGCSADQRMLSVVMPGHAIEPHRDMQAPNWHCRVHVPLLTNEFSAFLVHGKPHFLEAGTAYTVDTQQEHAVTNDGPTPRIHLMFDVRAPNA